MRRWDGENRLSNRFTMPRDGNANYRENDDEVVREIEILQRESACRVSGEVYRFTMLDEVVY